MNVGRLLFCFLIFSFSAQAQQLSLFTQYRENASIINPAALNPDFFAFGNNLSFGASYRVQWVGLDASPRTQTFHGEYFASEYTGVAPLFGLYAINDETGPTGFSGFYLRGGGVISEDPEYAGIAIGINAGIVQYRVNVSEIKLRDKGDVLGTVNQTQLYPDVGFGVYAYQTLGGGFLEGDFVYLGLSVPQALGLNLAFQDEQGDFEIQRVQHFYGLLGMYKFLSDDTFLEPSVWIKYVQGAPINADFNLRFQMIDSFWAGTGLSLGGMLHIEAGVLLGRNLGLDNTLKLGYSFDYSFSQFGPTAGITHELNLAFSMWK